MKRFLIVLLAAITCLSGCNNSNPTMENTTVASDDHTSSTTTNTPETTIPTDLSALFQPTIRDEGNYTMGNLSADGSYISGNYSAVDGATVQKYPRLTNLATLYLDFPSEQGFDRIQHGVYTDATYTFVDQYVEDSYYELPLQIKGRGNYSWTMAQKPYSLKLGEKADFLFPATSP